MDITPEDFERFLTWLDPDREAAIAKYEVLRTRLTRYFLCRGWGVESEELTDETINRVIIKMRELADSYVGDRMPYFLAVARFVNKERLKRLKEDDLLRRMMVQLVGDSSTEKEMRDRCLRRCMKKIPPKNQDLIQRYYIGEKQEKIAERKKLAEEWGIEPNALRIRAHRIRTELRKCLEKCIAEENDDEE